MQTIISYPLSQSKDRNTWLQSIKNWLHAQEQKWEESRFLLVAVFIVLQVSIAGFNVVIPPMAGASIYIMAPGIFLAFISNSIAYAQMKMRWVLAAFILSMLINFSISLFYLIKILNT